MTRTHRPATPSVRVCALRLSAALALAVSAGVGACKDEGPDGPESHTVVRGGVSHRVGLDDPLTNCTPCHGADLTGGTNGEPSCLSCHGVRW